MYLFDSQDYLLYLQTVEESLPGNPIIDKPLLPPIISRNTNIDPEAILNRPKTGFPQSQLQRQTLPKLEGGSFPPTNTHLPFDAISKSSTLISDSHASLKNAKDDDLNESKSSTVVQETSAELPESAKKYEVVEDKNVDIQNEENASKMEAILEPTTGKKRIFLSYEK